jgi:uncharacterized protein YceK
MKSLLLIAIVLGLIGCTHNIEMQIEKNDGRVVYYETYHQSGPHSEKWTCKQIAVAKLTAEYACHAMLWE